MQVHDFTGTSVPSYSAGLTGTDEGFTGALGNGSCLTHSIFAFTAHPPLPLFLPPTTERNCWEGSEAVQCLTSLCFPHLLEYIRQQGKDDWGRPTPTSACSPTERGGNSASSPVLPTGVERAPPSLLLSVAGLNTREKGRDEGESKRGSLQPYTTVTLANCLMPPSG